ncbi:MAG TPA: hypothetical protein VD966_02550, partial [Pyrinomonadaceae bacterium]|nr:hypothetical protein [Pyrinomonadaceae bacterium]
AMLGAPGPENLNSPRVNIRITPSLIDPTAPSTLAPNLARIQCSAAGPSAGTPVCDQSTAGVAALGFLSVRRKFTNNTGVAVTRLRFRVIDITNITNGGGLEAPVADLRAITSPDVTVSTGLGPVAVSGTKLETPPAQPLGGGVNASLSVETITSLSSLVGDGSKDVGRRQQVNNGARGASGKPSDYQLSSPLAAGSSIDVQLLLGVNALGRFRFLILVEALP